MRSLGREGVTRSKQPHISGSATSGTALDQFPEPFYTDEEINILHDVVALASEDLATASSPKALPAAFLFKAYDEVLPQYGIDPDEDHHLSAFVFRVGGEEGDTPLLEKFQSILRQLGIAVQLATDQDQDIARSPVSSRSGPLHRRSALVHDSSPRSSGHRPTTVSEEDVQSEDIDVDYPLGHNGDFHNSNYRSPRRPIELHSVTGDGASLGISNHQKADSDARLTELNLPLGLQSQLDRWIRAAEVQRDDRIIRDEDEDEDEDENDDRDDGHEVPTTQPPWERYNHGSEIQVGANKAPQRIPAFPMFSNLDHESVTERTQADEGVMRAPNHFTGDQRLLPQAKPVARYPDPKAQVSGTAQEFKTLNPVNGISLQSQRSGFAEHATSMVPIATLNELQQDVHEASRTPAPAELSVPQQAQQQKLMYRAARTRQLYLVSKYFNRWVDRTARRLVREGVARRHILRFRCFKGWKHLPDSRESTARELQLSTAFRKFRRILHEQQQQQPLPLTPDSAPMHLIALGHRLLDHWQRSSKLVCLRLRHVELDQHNAVRVWRQCVRMDAEATAEGMRRSQIKDSIQALGAWRHKMHCVMDSAAQARIISRHRSVLPALAKWADGYEAYKRAKIHQQRRKRDTVQHIEASWSLAARAQAYRWHCEFASASRNFDTWCDASLQAAELPTMAARCQAQRASHLTTRALSHMQRRRKRLDRTQNRVRLFITATQVMNVFEDAAKQRKAQEKRQIKKALMSKYQQASSARRKRQFFTTLKSWQRCAEEAQEQSEIWSIQETQRYRACLQAVQAWVQFSELGVAASRASEQHHAGKQIATWNFFATNHALNTTSAHNAYEIAGKRAAVKDWSIKALQRSGQMHIAGAAYQNQLRSKYYRALVTWKQKAAPLQDDETNPGNNRNHGMSWPLPAGQRKPLHGRSVALSGIDTPTRWTGRPSLLNSIFRPQPMPVLEEMADSPAASVVEASDRVPAMNSPSRSSHSGRLWYEGLPSTTPMGPVPLHLSRGFKMHSDHRKGRELTLADDSPALQANRFRSSTASQNGMFSSRRIGNDTNSGTETDANILESDDDAFRSRAFLARTPQMKPARGGSQSLRRNLAATFLASQATLGSKSTR